MVIILEGIDRVGKTTLANKIKEEVSGSEIFKAERIKVPLSTLEENNTLNYGYCMGQVQLLNNTYANDKERHMVIDRFHWTEYIYTKVSRDRNVTDYYVKQIENEMLKNRQGYLMILMMPINITLCSRMHGSSLKEHQLLFNGMYEESKLLKYRCTYHSSNFAVDAVKKIIDGEYVKQGE